MKKVQLLIVCLALLLWSGVNAQERRTVHSGDAITLKDVPAINMVQKVQTEAELKAPLAAESKKTEKQQRSVAADCSVPVFPLNEDFSGITSSLQFPPDCWEIFDIDGNSQSWSLVWGNYDGKSYTATKSTSSGETEDNWLVMPLVAVPTSGNIILQFKNVLGCYNVGGIIHHGVYVSAGSSNPADGNFTEVWAMPQTGISGNFTPTDINLSAYAGQNIYIGFRFAGNNQWDWSITGFKVFDTDKIDAQIVSITAPISNGDLGNETVKAVIKNNGGQDITGFTLKLEVDGAEVATETYTGSISPFEEVEYTFTATANLSAEGDHVIKVTVNLTGDEDASNNSFSKTVTNTICRPVTQYPWSEGFEGEAFPPACWASYNIDGDNLSWEKYPYYRHSGSASANHNWSDNNQEGWLVTPQLSIPSTGNYVLIFWSYTGNFRGNDECGIYASVTGNNPSADTFTEIKTLSGDEVSSSGSFKEIVVPLSDYAGQNIYIGFKHKSDDRLDWYIDDVEVMDAAGKTDAAVLSVESTPSGINLTSTEPVKTVIKNNGYLPLTGFSLKLEVDGAEVTTETYTGSIPALSQVEYTFTATADLSVEGTHNIAVTVIATNDTDASNNSKNINVSNTICNTITSFPWREGFDNDISACWQNINNDGDGWGWIYGTLNATGDGIVVSYSKDPYFGGALTPDNYLITPQIVLPDTQYNLLFTVAANTDNFAEKYSVMVSTTGTDVADFTEIYTETLTAKDFKVVTVPLSAYSGPVYIAIRHWDCTNQSALLLDDIMVMKGTGYADAEMVSVESPVSGANLSSTEPVKVKIKNKGTEALSSFSLKVEVNGAEAFTESYTGAPIPSFSIADYTLTNTLDLSAEGTYSIKATVVADNDIDAANDSKTIGVVNEIINCPGTVRTFPWTEGFENITFAPCWTTIDADGDGYNWKKYTDYSHSGTGAAMSESYSNNVGVLTPDNYLITPQITLPADGEAALSFWIRGIEMVYYAEHYEVKVSTTGNNASDFTATLVDETLDSSQWKEKNVSLDDYLGQSIYVAFVHNKVSDQYRLVLDDVTVTATGSVGVEEQKTEGVKVYPNPVKDVLRIDAPEAIQKVSIYNASGKLVQEVQNATNSVNVSHLTQGVYIVKVISESGIFRAKILKQ